MSFKALFLGFLAIGSVTASPLAPRPSPTESLVGSNRTDNSFFDLGLEGLIKTTPEHEARNASLSDRPSSNHTSDDNSDDDNENQGLGRRWIPRGPWGQVPFQYLPECHQHCWTSECCNAPFIKDVRVLTLVDFCQHNEWNFQNWFLDHMQYCLANNCRGCGDCADRSRKWYRAVCEGGPYNWDRYH
ncbi:hypothetical protein F4778DRAFT_795347 [Xylariomycetidae sp. FL2044]|nr:hypothetical protein F4778DRAFT_795347 [Xylariomycetidae sp. FL2044]